MKWNKKYIIGTTIVIIFLFGLTSNWVKSASFDCSKARSPVELTICTDKRLNDEDSRLGEVYLRLIQSMNKNDVIKLKAEQLKWIEERDRLCSSDDVECLIPFYSKRIAVMESKASDLDKRDRAAKNILDRAFEIAKTFPKAIDGNKGSPGYYKDLHGGYIYLLADIVLIYAQLGYLDEAEEKLKIIKNKGVYEYAKAHLTVEFSKVGNFEKAIDYANTLKSNEAKEQALFGISNQLIKRKRFDDAKKILIDLEYRLYNHYNSTFFTIVKQLVENGFIDEALNTVHTRSQFEPHGRNARFYLINYFFSKNKIEEAQKIISEFGKPRKADANEVPFGPKRYDYPNYELASLYARLGEHDRALQFVKAINDKLEVASAYIKCAETSLNKKDQLIWMDRAYQAGNKYYLEDPEGNWTIILNIARGYARINCVALAEKVIEENFKKESNYRKLGHESVAKILMRKGKTGLLYQYLEKTKIEDNDVKRLMAISLLFNGKEHEALNMIKSFQARNSAFYQSYVAIALASMCDNEKTLIKWYRQLTLNHKREIKSEIAQAIAASITRNSGVEIALNYLSSSEDNLIKVHWLIGIVQGEMGVSPGKELLQILRLFPSDGNIGSK